MIMILLFKMATTRYFPICDNNCWSFIHSYVKSYHTGVFHMIIQARHPYIMDLFPFYTICSLY